MLTWTIARRFAKTLRRNGFARFTSVVAVVSVCLGTLALCLSQSILAGYDEMIQLTARRFGMNLTVQRADALLISDATSLKTYLQNLSNVASVGEGIRQETLVKSRTALDGAVLVGLPTQLKARAFTDLIVEGSNGSGRDEVTVGSGIALKLRVHVGDSVTLITRAASEDRPTVSKVRIAGVFSSGMASYDDHAVVTSTEIARRIIRAENTASSLLMVTCSSAVDEPIVAENLRRRFHSRLLVLTYRDHFAAIWNWIDLQRRPIPIIMSLIAIVSMFTVISTILLAIVEKTRSLAVLSTIGMSPWQLSLITAVRVLSTTVFGVTLGLMISVVLILVQRTWHLIQLDGGIYYVQHLPVAFEPAILLRSGMLILLAACTAALVPMVITMRIRPVRALRFR